VDKQLNKLFKELERQGFRIETKKKGYMIYPADKSLGQVTVHKTPSDNRAWNNMLSELRRCGFDNRK